MAEASAETETVADKAHSKPFAVIAGVNANCRLNQQATDRCFATTVSKNKAEAVTDQVDLVAEIKDAIDRALKTNKCTTRFVPNAEQNAKCRFDRLTVSKFSATNVLIKAV